jgi:hypothetical protein
MALTVEIKGKQITFDVTKDSDGNAALTATHIDGVETCAGYIAGVTSEGKLVRYSGINEQFGFKLTSNWHIKQFKE